MSHGLAVSHFGATLSVLGATLLELRFSSHAECLVDPLARRMSSQSLVLGAVRARMPPMLVLSKTENNLYEFGNTNIRR